MIRIALQAEQNRAAAYDGDVLAGRCEFEKTAAGWNILHTVVEPAYGGQGLASRLVACVAEAAAQAGVSLAADCGYAREQLKRRG